MDMEDFNVPEIFILFARPNVNIKSINYMIYLKFKHPSCNGSQEYIPPTPHRVNLVIYLYPCYLSIYIITNSAVITSLH